MQPQDIQQREFMVSLRGYSQDEVRDFLNEIAAELAGLHAELEAVRSSSVRLAADDDFDNLGASVAAVLRAAKEAAADVATTAEAHALEVREEADRFAAAIRAQAEQQQADADQRAEAAREHARSEAHDLRVAAAAALDAARSEADEIVRNAAERARKLEIEAEATINNQIEAAERHEHALRARLLDASEELQLALLALGDAPRLDEQAPALHLLDDASVDELAG